MVKGKTADYNKGIKNKKQRVHQAEMEEILCRQQKKK